MNPLHLVPRLAAPCLLLILTACGGGGGGTPLDPGGPAPVATASLDGQVLEIDGQTTALDGVRITLAETGGTAVTGADGSFSFGAVPTGSLTLRVDAPTAGFLVLAASNSGSGSDDSGGRGGAVDDSPDEDEIEDGEDLDDDDSCEVHRVQEQERIRVRLRIRDGTIEEMQCSREQNQERETEIRMIRAATSDDPDIEGKLELERRTDRERFKVEVEYAAMDRRFELFVIDDQGVEESQGVRVATFEGEARWEFDTSEGERLPFGVASVEDLAGCLVQVRDADTQQVMLQTQASEGPPVVGDGDQESEQTRFRARVRLQAQEQGVDGYVEIRSRPEEGEERFDMEAEQLGAGRRVDFEIEASEDSGEFLRIRTMIANEDGEAELELDTGDGDVLPNGALGVRELVHLRVRVRDADSGAVLLSGTIPSLVEER